ncbi:MAG: zinc ribbon domain-containing protein [Planctomycetes bacterium]|nr:zinc ribbon domain-containing protein [Planctomycetota bacterium]
MTTATCTACSHPLTASDRFCPGCGRGTVTEPVLRVCPRCSRPVGEGAFCSNCGQRVTIAATGSATGFQWKWAALTVPIVVGTTVVFMIAAGVILNLQGTTDVSPAVGLLIAVLGIFAGGLVAGFLSPTRTVLEPGVGIAATVIVMNLAMGDIGGMLLGWLIPLGLGSLGAALGEFLQRSRSHNA